jgi:redox-sensitive bicupin YhaK (pirin superfamily)
MAQQLTGKTKDLDGIKVTRILPHAEKRMVGPFIFLDHTGPASFPAGNGIDVRPHPHIGLATITYLFSGSILHRDSLGNCLEILPGDVNWMTAGRGIVHSERESHEVKATEHQLDGLQCWIALPKEFAEVEPHFYHYKKESLSSWIKEGVFVRLIVGEAYGASSPIKTYSPMFYLDVLIKSGQTLERPNPHQECAAYIINGSVKAAGNTYVAGDFILLDEQDHLAATANARVMLLGGDHWPEVPRMYWNFVSFDTQRIEQAKEDWREQRFPKVPGDDQEYTPLPSR